MWDRLIRLFRAMIGDDGTGPMWQRLTPDSQDVIQLAYREARELGHPCLADEHVLLGLLRHGTSRAAALLRAEGLELVTARAELIRVGPTLGARVDPAGALRALGIDAEDVRGRLEANFGTDALQAAERRVRRRPRWRGGHPRPSPLCVYILAKRSFEMAARFADRPRRGRDRARASALRPAPRRTRSARNPAQPAQPPRAGSARLDRRPTQPPAPPARGTQRQPHEAGGGTRSISLTTA